MYIYIGNGVACLNFAFHLKQAAAGAYLQDDTVLISVRIGSGSGTGTAWGCDLTYKYVEINAEYTT